MLRTVFMNHLIYYIFTVILSETTAIRCLLITNPDSFVFTYYIWSFVRVNTSQRSQGPENFYHDEDGSSMN